MKAINSIWTNVHGPPQELILGKESAVKLSQAVERQLLQQGIKVHLHSKGQHEKFIERRGSLLQDSLHRVDGQLAEEGINDIQIADRLSEAVFSGNAMLTVGGSTPYNALYGNVPCILPGIEQTEDLGKAEWPNLSWTTATT